MYISTNANCGVDLCRRIADSTNLLSNDIGVVACLDFEGAVVRPQVNGYTDTSYAALINHFSCLGASNTELHVGIFLPVSEEQREFRKEAVKDIPSQSNGLGRTIPV
jgi:hypothetical protein